MISMRKSNVGIIQSKGLDDDLFTHFAEVWSGEGVDFTFIRDKEEKHIYLSMEHLLHIATVSKLLGMVDDDEVKEMVNKCKVG